jgi:hypothetical protein
MRLLATLKILEVEGAIEADNGSGGARTTLGVPPTAWRR